MPPQLKSNPPIREALALNTLDPVPDAIRPGRAIAQGFGAAGVIEIAPAVKCGPRDAELLRVRLTGMGDCSTSRMISAFSDAGYLMPRPPHPRSCFFEQTVFQRQFATRDFFA
jgi:hypothetical protein